MRACSVHWCRKLSNDMLKFFSPTIFLAILAIFLYLAPHSTEPPPLPWASSATPDYGSFFTSPWTLAFFLICCFTIKDLKEREKAVEETENGKDAPAENEKNWEEEEADNDIDKEEERKRRKKRKVVVQKRKEMRMMRLRQLWANRQLKMMRMRMWTPRNGRPIRMTKHQKTKQNRKTEKVKFKNKNPR